MASDNRSHCCVQECFDADHNQLEFDFGSNQHAFNGPTEMMIVKMMFWWKEEMDNGALTKTMPPSCPTLAAGGEPTKGDLKNNFAGTDYHDDGVKGDGDTIGHYWIWMKTKQQNCQMFLEIFPTCKWQKKLGPIE